MPKVEMTIDLDAIWTRYHASETTPDDVRRLLLAYDGAKEQLSQSERATEAERAARRAFEADAVQLRTAALAYVRATSYAERLRLRAELEVLATVEHPGVLIVQELKLLRELSDDLTRWREAGGDIRDLTYVFETMDKIEKTKEGMSS